jgi:hypothetical protein
MTWKNVMERRKKLFAGVFPFSKAKMLLTNKNKRNLLQRL